MAKINGEKVSLKEFVDVRFRFVDQSIDELEKRFEIIDRMNQVAIEKAVFVIDDRLAMMNEFRAQMKDQAATFLTKNEFNMFDNTIGEKIRALEDSKALLEDRATRKDVNIAKAISYISFSISLFVFLTKYIKLWI